MQQITRTFWLNKIIGEWDKRPVLWLAGVRRSGKTTLTQSIPNSLYLNCDLKSTQELIEDPEKFYRSTKENIIVFDEIHQLPEASIILKIGADQFKDKKIIATGSSMMIASQKFKDSLTGRKKNIHFPPLLIEELELFNVDLKKRLLFGGLPQSIIQKQLDHDFFAEWIDSFYARDIQELFKVAKRQPFIKTLEFLIEANGNQFEVSKLAQSAGISRPTAIKYLDILEVTKAITLVRPFSNNVDSEIVSQPKIYIFDTGFYCHVQRIKELRNEDCGLLLENLVLENFQSKDKGQNIYYWRTKQKNEIDFVYPVSRTDVIAIECKWKEAQFSDQNLKVFRARYPKGQNWVITSDSKTRKIQTKDLELNYINIFDLPQFISKHLAR